MKRASYLIDTWPKFRSYGLTEIENMLQVYLYSFFLCVIIILRCGWDYSILRTTKSHYSFTDSLVSGSYVH